MFKINMYACFFLSKASKNYTWLKKYSLPTTWFASEKKRTYYTYMSPMHLFLSSMKLIIEPNFSIELSCFSSDWCRLLRGNVNEQKRTFMAIE